MKNSDIDFLYILQDIYSSTATLAIMVGATSDSISKMYNWPYSKKNEMKKLGGTINQMKDKSVEIYILGISKMVEDFFNNIDRYGRIKLSIWDSSIHSITFSKEVRFIRHLGNLIKHNNSIIESTNGGRSAKALINEFGLEDDIPIHWLNVFKNSERDSMLQYIYKANYFCFEVLRKEGLWSGEKQALEDDEIVRYMVEHYIHSIPGHPNKREKNY